MSLCAHLRALDSLFELLDVLYSKQLEGADMSSFEALQRILPPLHQAITGGGGGGGGGDAWTANSRETPFSKQKKKSPYCEASAMHALVCV